MKPALLRFPALFVLGLVVSVCLSLQSASWRLFYTAGMDSDSLQWHEMAARRNAFESLLRSFALPGLWGMALSVLLQLLCERINHLRLKQSRLLPLLVQGAVCVLSLFPASLFFRGDTSLMWIVFFGVFAALCAGIAFVLMRSGDAELVVPNCVMASLIAGIACGCVSAGGSLVYLAVKLLLVSVPEAVDEVIGYLILFTPSFVVFTGLFVAYTTRPAEEISIPKAYRVIMLYILLPLYTLLVAVLYGYLLKSLVTRTMPSGKINPFVSCATAFYLFFYFAVSMYKTRFVELFRKAGPFVLLPLVAIQCLAFGLRVSAYSYTQARAASLLYIVFSVACLVLAVLRRGKYMAFAPCLLAVFLLVGSIGPLNIKACAVRSQSARIFRIYRSHNLAVGGEGASRKLSEEEKAVIVDAWRCLDAEEDRYAWAEGARYESDALRYAIRNGALVSERVVRYDFDRLFGFPYSAEYGKSHGYVLAYRTDTSEEALDVSSFHAVWQLENLYEMKDGTAIDEDADDSPNRICVGYGRRHSEDWEHSYDITDELYSRLERMDWDESLGAIADAPCHEERLFLSMPDGTTLVLTQVERECHYDADGKLTFDNASVRGYACR